jgi:hypothetical protein
VTPGHLIGNFGRKWSGNIERLLCLFQACAIPMVRELAGAMGRMHITCYRNVIDTCTKHIPRGHTPMSKRPKGLGISWKPTHTFRLSLPNQSRLRAKDTTPNTRAIPSTREASKFGTTSAFACLSLAGSRPGLLSSPYYLPSAPTLKARDRHERKRREATASNLVATGVSPLDCLQS